MNSWNTGPGSWNGGGMPVIDNNFNSFGNNNGGLSNSNFNGLPLPQIGGFGNNNNNNNNNNEWNSNFNSNNGYNNFGGSHYGGSSNNYGSSSPYGELYGKRRK